MNGSGSGLGHGKREGSNKDVKVAIMLLFISIFTVIADISHIKCAWDTTKFSYGLPPNCKPMRQELLLCSFYR